MSNVIKFPEINTSPPCEQCGDTERSAITFKINYSDLEEINGLNIQLCQKCLITGVGSLFDSADYFINSQQEQLDERESR